MYLYVLSLKIRVRFLPLKYLLQNEIIIIIIKLRRNVLLRTKYQM